MTRRSPAQYDWSKQLFDELLLKDLINDRRQTSPRRGRIKHIDIHHMTVRDSSNGQANKTCVQIWKTREASAHYGIDNDHVAQFIYDNAEAWGNANGKANQEGIVIEHANSTLGPKWEISDKTITSSVKLVAALHVTHNLGRPTSTGFGMGGTIRTHQSFYATSCPGPYFKKIWASYVKRVQAEYDRITNSPAPKPDPKPTPKPKYDRWLGAGFLNIFGDDGSIGTQTVSARLPTMVDDVTSQRDEVVAFCEVRTDQIKALTKAMKSKGYKLAGYSHRLALFVLAAVKVGKVSFKAYKKQNAGAVEGILRAHVKVNGHWVNVGVTHLDYRPNFDSGRVAQMREGMTSMKAFGWAYGWLGNTWKSRTLILTDANSENWVTDKVMKPAGFKAAARAVIDFIYVGATRPILEQSSRKTKSDHPWLRAVLGKKAK